MSVRRLLFPALAVAAAAGLVALTTPGCTERNPLYCDAQRQCPSKNQHCNEHNACEDNLDAAIDAPAERAETSDALDAMDTGDAWDGNDGYDGGCAALGCPSSGTPACLAGPNICVECTSAVPCKDPTTPVCLPDHTCTGCRGDTDCPAAPGICMPDGHCATPAESIYVEYSAGGCTGANGTAANPFCKFADATPSLTANRSVIVLRGPASDQLSLAPSGFTVTVVGQKNGNGEPLISAVNSTGIAVTAGQALVRDVKVGNGTLASGRGVSVSGSGTKLTLLRVTVSGLLGVGIEAKTGAELVANRCLVQSNSAGGVLNNGARTTITNSAILSNAYGIQFSASALTSSFSFNTVVGNPTATACDLSNAQSITSSIVSGNNLNCTVTGSVLTAPTFDGTGFHLTAHLACPGGAPALYPPDDYDGDARVSPIDCGADQFK